MMTLSDDEGVDDGARHDDVGCDCDVDDDDLGDDGGENGAIRR